MYSYKYHTVSSLGLGLRVKWRSDNYVTFAKHLFILSPHVRESKTGLDSGFHAVDSSPGMGFWMFCQWNWDSGFQSLVGFPDSLSRFHIPKPRIPNFTAKLCKIQDSKRENFADSGIRIPLHVAKPPFTPSSPPI